MEQEIKFRSAMSSSEKELRGNFIKLFRQCPIPDEEILTNLGLFIKRQDLTNILFKNELYQKILDVNGIIIEFGVRWGQNLALFESFRGIYEPFNPGRKILGFDTFEGFPSVHEKDGGAEIISAGSYSVTNKYEEYLSQVLDYHEQESPISHIRKYQLIKGDATIEIEKYLEKHPETIIAFAYFDFDIYQPTKRCLEMIMNHVTKGTVLGFDELNHQAFPGETIALKEVLGLNKYKIFRSKYSSYQSYLVID